MYINSINYLNSHKTYSKVPINYINKTYIYNHKKENPYITNISRTNIINFHGISGSNIESLQTNLCFRNYELNKYINYLSLRKAGIPNLQRVYNRGVRGMTLSSSHNTKYIPIIKDCGIDTIIDLRTADYTPRFKDKCDIFGLKYYHIPIDKKDVPDKEIIKICHYYLI